MVEIIKYDDFPYSSKYKQKYNQSSFYELLGNIFSKDFKEQLCNLYKELNIRVSYNEYLENLIEEVKLLTPRVPFTPYVPRYTHDTDEAFQERLELNKLQHETWFQEIKINKIEEIKNLIKPMNNPYSQLSKFLNTSSYLPFELYFEDVFEKGNKNNLSFVEFFDRLSKQSRSKEQYKSTITKSKSDITAEKEEKSKQIKTMTEQQAHDFGQELLDKKSKKEDNFWTSVFSHLKTDDHEYHYKNFKDKSELYVLCPNVEKENIQVTFETNVLKIFQKEAPYIFFKPSFKEIAFNVPPSMFDIENITSKLENGVLTITIPYLLENKSEQINIKVN